jgi:hypothetical protein
MALDAPPPKSPVTNQGYERPPGREITGLTRANRGATEIPAEPARPAPLFSNEGVVRQAEMGRLGRGLSLGGSASPDFDRHDEPRVRDGRRRRAIGVVLFAGILGFALLGVASTAVLSVLPNNAASSRSRGPSSDIALVVVNIQFNGRRDSHGNGRGRRRRPALHCRREPSGRARGDRRAEAGYADAGPDPATHPQTTCSDGPARADTHLHASANANVTADSDVAAHAHACGQFRCLRARRVDQRREHGDLLGSAGHKRHFHNRWLGQRQMRALV